MPDSEQLKSFDLIVCGGGMVGASLVAALIPHLETLNLRIALIEQSPLAEVADPQYQPSFDARATALAQGSRTAFAAMGVWEQIRPRVAPIDTIEVSDRGRFGQLRMTAAEEAVEALGYVVENHWLGQVLMSRVQAHLGERLQLFSPAVVESITPKAGYSLVQVSHGGAIQRLRADLIVMADGGRSELRRRMGIDYREQDYQQSALVANISLDRPHSGVAYERFTEEGPIALLPVVSFAGQPRMGLVWTLPEERVASIIALEDAEFLAELQAVFGFHAGEFVAVGERYSYPLKLMLADEQVRTGLVVLGNAAHSLHPIAGQGFNLALRGVCELAELVIERRKAGLRLGDLVALERFAQQRRGDQRRTIGFGDSALKIFTSHNPAVRLGRNLALGMLAQIAPARTVLARAAMGLDIPVAKIESED